MWYIYYYISIGSKQICGFGLTFFLLFLKYLGYDFNEQNELHLSAAHDSWLREHN